MIFVLKWFAAILHAGLEGISNKITVDPIEKNFYEMEEGTGDIQKLPTNLLTAIEELEKDTVIINALGKKAVELFVQKKRREWEQYIVETTDLEYKLYFNC